MPRLTKSVIWDRLRVKDIWLMPVRTPFWVAGEEHMQALLARLTQRHMRYVVRIDLQGNAAQSIQSANIEKLETDGVTFTMKWSRLPVLGNAVLQIPQGAYDIEDPIISVEGGANLYGQVDGNSVNCTVTYWDNEI